MQIAFFDDDPKQRREIRSYLSGLDEDDNWDLTEFSRAEKLAEAVCDNGKRFDIILIDVYENELPLGFEAARRIRLHDRRVSICFITLSEDTWEQGYEYDATGYILKPIDKRKFQNMIKRAINRVAEKSQPIVEATSRKEYKKIPVYKIAMVVVELRIIKYTLLDGEVIKTYGSFKRVASYLENYDFFPITRSCLINNAYIHEIKNDPRKVILINNLESDVEATRWRAFLKQFDEYLDRNFERAISQDNYFR